MSFGTSCLVTLYLLQYLGVVHAVAFLVAIPVTLPELLRASGIIDVKLLTFGHVLKLEVTRGVMISAVESIPESDFGHFLEFSDSDSNSIPQLS